MVPVGPEQWVFAYGDFVEYFYPMRAFVARTLRSGRLPLWNPFIYAGTPALADIQSATLYPLAVLTALMSGGGDLPFLALEAEAIFHFGLAGVFYLFARRLLKDRGGAVVTALTFTYGGYLTGYPSLQLAILEVSVWLPLLLLWLDWGCGAWPEPQGVARILLGGVVLAIALLAGHPQPFMYLVYTAAAFFVVRSIQRGLSVQQVGEMLVLWLGIGAGISAAQWIPTLELVRLSPRAALSYAQASVGLPPRELVGILLPGWVSYWSPLYVGLLPLILGELALALGRWRKAAFWAVLALVALLLAMGRHGFVYRFFYRWVPGFGLFRNQERAAYLVSFCLSVLAGYEFIVLSRAEDRNRLRRFVWIGVVLLFSVLGVAVWAFSEPAPWGLVARAVGLIATAVALLEGFARGFIGARALTFRAAGIILVDLFGANMGGTLAPAPPAGYFPRTGVVRTLQVDRDRPFRISSEGLLPADGNVGILYRLQDVVGSSPLHVAAYEAFLDEVQELSWWQLLNVRYVITQRHLTHGALGLVAQDNGANLYQFYGGLPHAWVVHRMLMVSNQKEAWQYLNQPDFDPSEIAVLKEDRALQVSDFGSLDVRPKGNSTVRIVSHEPGRILIDAQLADDGVLVLSEIFYPGWKAYVDGEQVEVKRADGILQAVPLPEGEWRVEMIYNPRFFKIGLGITGFTAVIAAVVWAWTKQMQGAICSL